MIGARVFRPRMELSSDLHLGEGTSFTRVVDAMTAQPTEAPILALLGDLCPVGERTKRFLERVAPCYEHILYVPGNHEYYSKTATVTDTENLLRSICDRLANVTLLQAATVRLHGTTYAGATLWSHVPLRDRPGLSRMKRFKRIRGFSIEERQRIHNAHRDFLLNCMRRGGTDVVLTHYPPLFELGGTKRGAPSTQLMASDYSRAVATSGWRGLWACGHGHVRRDLTRGHVRYITNCCKAATGTLRQVVLAW